MKTDFTPKDEAKLSLLREQITQCRNDTMTYNSQFLSASSLGAVLAALAAVFCATSDNPGIWNLFYILPTVYFLALYNLIKYTNEQLILGAYRLVLEHLTNQYFDEEILNWESKLTGDTRFYFLNGIAQIVFFLPGSIVMFWGFFQANKGWLWYITSVFLVLQCILILVMAVDLLHIRDTALKQLGYQNVDGKLSPLSASQDDNEKNKEQGENKP